MKFKWRNPIWVLILSLGTGLFLTQGCSETQFSSSLPSQVTKIGSPGTDASGNTSSGQEVVDPVIPVSDIVDDDVIDQEEEDVIDYYACGKAEAGDKKALICHYPPGNAAARHEICVGVAALKAHIDRHGDDQHKDHMGPCRDEEDESVDSSEDVAASS